MEHPSPAAYCLPGLRPRVVVTRGALSAPTGAEVAAVLGHERAHATGRHDLVVLARCRSVRGCGGAGAGGDPGKVAPEHSAMEALVGL